MNHLRLADLVVRISVRDVDDLDDLLERISGSGVQHTATYRLVVRRNAHAGLVVDDRRRTIALSLPHGPSTPVTHIAVLQALARGLAYIERSAPDLALLHGSALTTNDGAVAVLDGGLGQGKTSLALGLAHRCGSLLVDEFAFARTGTSGVFIAAAPTLPWHVRTDMAPYLAAGPGACPLRYPDQFRPVIDTSASNAAVRLILIPDQSMAPGLTERIEHNQVPHYLRHAVTDHLSKLANPRLDHVSIFNTREQVTDPTGVPLADRNASTAGRDTVLHMLAAIPTYRVGIGTPADVTTSVAAAGRLLKPTRT
ncbi:hypothetical protein [Rhizomonospora bruguierae]|uniref:hypothetical protein n=1 Tax=Rhizomonospora bruguierae TaxID=1581705 RepID=UPI001BD0EEFC|nr:hypothetical protein [Micromonospora sp. NBRC 107566]